MTNASELPEEDVKLFDIAMIEADKIAHDLMGYMCTQAQKVKREILDLDIKYEYAFTLHILALFIKKMAYSCEMYSLMRHENFEAEKVPEIIKELSLENMKDKKKEFSEITNAMIKNMKDRPNVKDCQ